MMGKMTEWLEMDDGHEIYLRSWVNEGESPKAIVQISHGMAEHIARYDDFAQFLLNRGIFVYGNDHRGHGHTGEKAGVFGYFAQKDGFDRVVNDLHAVTNHIKKLYPDKPSSCSDTVWDRFCHGDTFRNIRVISPGSFYLVPVEIQGLRLLSVNLWQKER